MAVLRSYTCGMSRLTTENYLAARRFLLDRGRTLERLMFEREFEGAPAWPVLDALSAYQNEDGGFGHALEPDSVTPASGALATSVALRLLADMGATAGHPLVVGAVRYLCETLGEDAPGVWRIVPRAAADSPHAPWWQQDGLAAGFGAFELNPRAEILAQLMRLGVDRAEFNGLLGEVLDAADRHAEHGMEMHDLMCCARLLDALPVHGPERERLRAALEPAARQALAQASQTGYGIRALDVAPTPSSVLAGAFEAEVAADLRALTSQQGEEGAWWPTWDWGEYGGPEYAAAWEQSRVAWAGVMTLDALRRLAAAGLVDRG